MFSIMILNIMVLSIMTLSKRTLIIMTESKTLHDTENNKPQQKNTQNNYA
jgi:hypothetical protein